MPLMNINAHKLIPLLVYSPVSTSWFTDVKLGPTKPVGIAGEGFFTVRNVIPGGKSTA